MTLYVQYTKNQAIKKWLPLELICAIYLEYIVTIHFVCPYPSVLTLYVQYTKTLAVKKWLPFELICAVYIVTLHSSPCRNLVQIWICRKIKCTPPSLASLNWAGCIINHKPFHYMFSGIHHEMTLYVQYTKNQAVKMWFPLELRYAVYLDYIVTIHFVCPYPSVLTLYVHYTKTLAVKKWLPFKLICAVYIITLNSSPCSNLVQIWIWRKIKCAPPSFARLGGVHNNLCNFLYNYYCLFKKYQYLSAIFEYLCNIKIV